ncbi:TIGR00730 family Rossman fold protein [Oceanobacter mangrovi]|uniref:LOG family protein n=1 Tax=Oceanobacter mangrovi TaxID=2862510 RepID=UPI001C8D37D5|nr:TIGR00730 family Rossman fold protein [Oceanobacter mangrovi]
MKVAVFCGSSFGHDPIFQQATKELGHYFAANHIEVVYGGGKVGLMGTIADAVMEQGGKVYGVIPAYLEQKEIGHQGLTELHVVADMHERKAMMASMADAFVALPGGVGTFEEIFEAWTWAQLGHHAKPCAFYNVNGYYDHLHAMLAHMAEAGFLKSHHHEMAIKADTPESLLEAFRSYQAPELKWD